MPEDIILPENVEVPEDVRGTEDEDLYRQNEANRLNAQRQAGGGEPTPPGAEPPAGGTGTPAPDPQQVEWGRFGENIDGMDGALSAMGSLKDEKTKLESQLQELNQQLEAATKSTIDDPALYRLNKIKKDDPDNFKLFSKILLGSDDLDHVDIVRQKLISENPGWENDIDAVNAFIEDEYGLSQPLPRKPDTDDPDELQAYEEKLARAKRQMTSAKMKLQKDANSFISTLKQKADGIELPERLTPEQRKEKEEARMTELKNKWGGYTEKVLESFKQFPVTVNNAEGKPEIFAHIDVPKEFLESSKESLYNTLINADADPEQAKQIAFTHVVGQFLMHNQPLINGAILSKAKEMTEEELAKFHTNTDILASQGGGEGITEKQRLYEESQRQLEEFLSD